MQEFSVIISCRNGAARLPTTLAHLIAQEPPMTPWEVLLIDNASTDGSAAVASSCWRNGPAPLRIIDESRPGVRYGRERGLTEANYEFLGFVDDDNWVARDGVSAAYDIISSDPSLGAVGSIRTPACEVSPPAWFEKFHSIYARFSLTMILSRSGNLYSTFQLPACMYVRRLGISLFRTDSASSSPVG